MKTATILFAVLTLFSRETLSNNPDSGFLFSDLTPAGATGVHAENVVRGGEAWDLDIFQAVGHPRKYVESGKKLNPCFAKAPEEQYPEVRYPNVDHSTPPPGFESGAVIAWVVAVNQNGSPGEVLVRALRVWGVDGVGHRHLITDKMICDSCVDGDRVWGYDMPRALWRDADAWRRPNHGSVFEVVDATIRIPTSSQPTDLFHFWSAVWPMPSVQPGWSYSVEAEVLPQGKGMIQVGLDYWQTATGGMNIQAANSSWACTREGSNWQTVRTGSTR